MQQIEKVDDLLDQLDNLLAENRTPGCRASIFLNPKGTDSPSTNIERFKEILKPVKDDLIDYRGRDKNKFGQLLAQLNSLPSEKQMAEVWQSRNNGLAIFANENRVRAMLMPVDFAEKCFISTHWHLTPLLALGANADRYWLLLLDRSTLCLLRGSRLGLRKVDLPEYASILATAGMREFTSEEQAITESDESLIRFAEEINRTLISILGDDSSPLILAGHEHLLRGFKRVSEIPNMVEQHITGVSIATDLDELHRIASKQLTGDFTHGRKQELLRIDSMFETHRVVTDLRSVLSAAHEGRIAALVAPSDEVLWGRNDDPLRPWSFEKSSPRNFAGRDVYQWVAEAALHHGGRLFYLESNKMPHGKTICAELRS